MKKACPIMLDRFRFWHGVPCGPIIVRAAVTSAVIMGRGRSELELSQRLARFRRERCFGIEPSKAHTLDAGRSMQLHVQSSSVVPSLESRAFWWDGRAPSTFLRSRPSRSSSSPHDDGGIPAAASKQQASKHDPPTLTSTHAHSKRGRQRWWRPIRGTRRRKRRPQPR